MAERRLRVAHLYPELLNLYGDSGNVLVLRKRMEWRGMEARVTPIAAGGDQSLSGADRIIHLGCLPLQR